MAARALILASNVSLNLIARRAYHELVWLASPRDRWIERANEHRWVFVTGCNRSGKTTLSNLFRYHPEVTVIPNASKVTRALPDPERDGFRHIWVEALDRFRLDDSDSLAPGDRLAFDWLHHETSPRETVMLESGLASIQLPWLQRVFPEAAFVGMVRNGYAVAQGLRLKEDYAIARCAAQWARSTETMLADSSKIPRFLTVRYEAFVSQPENEVRSLCDFLELSPDPLLPKLEAGWQLGNMDHRESRLVDDNPRLIAQLSATDLEQVRSIAGPLLEELGYHTPVAPNH